MFVKKKRPFIFLGFLFSHFLFILSDLKNLLMCQAKLNVIFFRFRGRENIKKSQKKNMNVLES